jgi:hypothetical protein
MNIYEKLINEIINMKDMKFPDVNLLAKYVKWDLRLNNFVNTVSFNKKKVAMASKFLNKFYEGYGIEFYVEYTISENGQYSSGGSHVRRKTIADDVEEEFPSLVEINIEIPNKNVDYLKVSKLIRRVLIHELVHHKQSVSTTNNSGNFTKQYASYPANKEDPINWVKYYLHQLERGAFAYAWAREFFGENINFKEIVKEKIPKFIENWEVAWPSLNSMQKKEWTSSLKRFEKEYYNQLYLLQQEYGKK